MKYNESLKGQEASLESSKGFYEGSKSNLDRGARSCQVLNIHAPKSMKIYENSDTMKIMKIP